MDKKKVAVPLVCHGHSRPVVDLFYSPITPDGFFLISASKDSTPMLRNGETGDWIGTFEGHKGAVWSCCLDTNALRAASASADFTAKLWDALTGDVLHSFDHKHIVRACSFSEDTHLLLTGGFEKILRIFDLNRPDAPPREVEHSPGSVRTVAWLHSDQTILSSCSDSGGVRLWDVRSGKIVHTLETKSSVTSAEVSKDGRYITTADGSSVKFWDANHFGLVKSYDMPCNVESASLEPKFGDKFIAGGEDMWIRLFDFNTGEEIGCNKGHHGPVHCVRFSPGGESYASGSEDGTIRIWQTLNPKEKERCGVPLKPKEEDMASFSIATVFIASISLLFAFSHSFSLENPTDRRILVLVDDLALKSSHSIFFSSLQTRGFELDFKLSDDPKIALQRYGQYLYDGLILFSPTIERFGGSLDVAAILDFVDSGKDLIVAADASASDLIRNIAAECGVDFDEDPSAVVIDHGSYAVSGTEGDHTLIAADDFIQSDVLLGTTKIEAPVLFKGIGHSLNPANSLVLKVLSASPSAYSANPKSKLSSPPSLSGSSISLVSVVQARNNARILFSGSLDLFSNKFFISPVQKAGSPNKYAKSGNQQFVTELSKWVFHERGHLKAVNVRHHRVDETDEPAIYRINDDLEYLVEIYEWSGSSWEPYVANDVQVQFYMMSPYVLKTLSTDKKGLYHTFFKVPDVYGVFQFKVEYQRLGYTSLSLAKQIPVRPFRHNEYERFIPTAFPYYGASFSTMAAFFIFSFAYLYSK